MRKALVSYTVRKFSKPMGKMVLISATNWEETASNACLEVQGIHLAVSRA